MKLVHAACPPPFIFALYVPLTIVLVSASSTANLPVIVTPTFFVITKVDV